MVAGSAADGREALRMQDEDVDGVFKQLTAVLEAPVAEDVPMETERAVKEWRGPTAVGRCASDCLCTQ